MHDQNDRRPKFTLDAGVWRLLAIILGLWLLLIVSVRQCFGS